VVSNLGDIGIFAVDGRGAGERRSHRRKSVLSEMGEMVVVSLHSERGLLLTLSASGISVQGQAQLSPGRRLPVQFSLPSGGETVRATCDVVWASENCAAGLKFVFLPEGDGLALGKWLALHAAEPEDVMAEATAASMPSGFAAGTIPAPTAFTELAESIEKLIAPEVEQPAASESAPVEAIPVPQNEAAPEEGTTLEELLPRTVMQARALTQAEGAALVLGGDEGLTCRASSGSAPALGSRLRPDSGLSGECFRLGQLVRCDDVRTDSRVNAAVAQRLQSRSILIVPIRVNGSTRGVLQVLSSQPFSFTAQHAVTLEHLAESVGSLLAAQDAPAESEPVPEAEDNSLPESAETAGASAPDSVAVEPRDSEPPQIIEEEPRAAGGIRRYGTIGALGLLTAGSLLLIMIRVPQPSRAAFPAAKALPVAVAAAAPFTSSQSVAAEIAPVVQPVINLKQPKAVKSAAAQPKPKPAEKRSAIVDSHSPMNLPLLTPRTSDAASSAPMTATATLAAPMPTLVAPASIPVRQSAGVERGRAISQPKPVYPPAALRSGIEGPVVVSATIGADGKVKKVAVVSGAPVLAQAAVDAVKRWRYQPSYLNGAAVEIDSTITLNFKRP